MKCALAASQVFLIGAIWCAFGGDWKALLLPITGILLLGITFGLINMVCSLVLGVAMVSITWMRAFAGVCARVPISVRASG